MALCARHALAAATHATIAPVLAPPPPRPAPAPPCTGEVTVDKGAGRVEASMILKWYGGDFGTKAQLLDFLARHLPPGASGRGGGAGACVH